MDWTAIASAFRRRSRSQSSSFGTRIFVDELDEVGFTLNNDSEYFDTAVLSDDLGYSDEEVYDFNDDSEVNRIQYDDDDDDDDVADGGVSLSIVMSDIFEALAHQSSNTDASKTCMDAVSVLKINEKHVDEELNCSICKDRFELGCEAKELPCKHLYHAECILPWLKYRSNTCPLCRYELPTEKSTSSYSPSINSINDD